MPQPLPLIKICELCQRVQKYNPGDRLPHWADLTLDERCHLERTGCREHHTICPDCKGKIRERDTRLQTINSELRTPPREAQ